MSYISAVRRPLAPTVCAIATRHVIARLLAIMFAGAFATCAVAEPADSATDSAADSAADPVPGPAPDDFHQPASADIIVTAPVAQLRLDSVSAVIVLQGADLAAALRPGLGDTLAHTAGVSASSFGPVASRPILRGLQGERIQILTDGIGTIDVSSVSADHAVAIDPLLADRIEVLRGPQALLYGTSVIGGAINIRDRRIPRALPDEPVHVQGLANLGSAANERAGSVAADVAVGGLLVLHADGSYQATDDLGIGGYALTPAARRIARQSAALPPADRIDADGEPLDFAANAAVRGTLPNSHGRSWTAGVGAALITEGGTLGVSYSRMANRYGVPIRFAIRPGEEQEAPTIDLVQNRFDVRAEADSTGAVIQAVKLRFGYASYRHAEIEDTGEVASRFRNKGLEGRIELVQAAHGRWTGASGAQLAVSDFQVAGEDAFVPASHRTGIGLFTLQQLDFDAVKLQAALRFDRTTLTAAPRPDEGFFAGSRRFATLSASLGASLRLGEGWRLGVNVARSGRAPAAEELFADGAHGGTQSYEVGDPGLAAERAWGAEAVLRGVGDGFHIEASAYASRYTGFIYSTPTGTLVDGLPVYQTQQGRARYVGFEVQGAADLLRFGGATLGVDALADYVRATIVGVGPAPQIPPLRALAGMEVRGRLLDVRGEVELVSRQRRVAAYETPTAGYALVNMAVTVRPWGEVRPLTLTLAADNLFDVNARRHASLLKDYAPLAGRDLRLTAQFSF